MALEKGELKKFLEIRKAVLETQTDEQHARVDKDAFLYASGQLKVINEIIEICNNRKRY